MRSRWVKLGLAAALLAIIFPCIAAAQSQITGAVKDESSLARAPGQWFAALSPVSGFAGGSIGGDDNSWDVAQLKTHPNNQCLKSDPPWIYFGNSPRPNYNDQCQRGRQSKDRDPKPQAEHCARHETENGE